MPDDRALDICAALRPDFPSDGNEVSVTPDRYYGYRIRIVSQSFSGQPKGVRRSRVLSIVSDDEIAALELLTPGQVGTEEDPATAPRETHHPLWPDSLAEGVTHDEILVNLPSEDQEQLDRPVVATFYSLRGGVGRSTALTHTAFNLADQGLSVLCIDMDLEAPGLSALFGVDRDLRPDVGVVRLLNEIEMSGEVPNTLTDHFIRVPTSNANQRLELLPAGIPSAQYARDLALLDPSAWYQEELNPLRLLIEELRRLPDKLTPDVILVDSRTGLSPIAAPLLFDIADLAIITFLPHTQAKLGTELLTKALLSARTHRSLRENRSFTPEPRFVISPVPPSEENFARAQETAISWISDWLGPARNIEGEKPFDDLEEIMHVVGYSEEIATSDGTRAPSPHAQYEPISAWIAGLVASSEDNYSTGNSATESDGASKSEVLDDLNFNGQTADTQTTEALRDIFVGTDSVFRALDPSTRLVIGRKGTGKTLLFRQMLAERPSKCIAVTSPDGKETSPLVLDGGQYRGIAHELTQQGLGWDTAWRAIIGLALVRADQATLPTVFGPLEAEHASTYRGATLIGDLRKILGHQDSELVLADWLAEIDDGLSEPLHLLFDGLDTGFGRDRTLRGDAVTGLLLLLNGQARRLENLRFRVFLREDIFRSVDLPNKSHLRAEAAVLAWNDQFDYLRIAIRQAWRSQKFRDLVARHPRLAGFTGGQAFDFTNTVIEYWPDDIVLSVWRILVGERMSGGKTAFTHRWVWSRLADANGDHAPRHLVTLFEEATTIEKGLEPGTPYARAVIRPRALADALDRVSIDAVEALQEEFPELEDLLLTLRSVARTPFESDYLAPVDDASVELAAEVGVLERAPDGRFRVPELYRRALSMTRQGQR